MPALKKVFPILEWLTSYSRKWLRPDIIAGMTVAAFAIPESMANASLIGVPVQAGLYAAIMALLAYAIFGTSRQLSIGPTTAISVIVATSLSSLAGGDASRYLALAAITAVLVGIISILAWSLRLSFIVNLISGSVFAGYSLGTALVLLIGQLPKLFGYGGIVGNFFERLVYFVGHLGDTNVYAILIGIAAIVTMVIIEKKLPKLPGPLVVLLGSVVFVTVTGLASRDIEVVGRIPEGLPFPVIPSITLSDISSLITLAAACFLLAYISDFKSGDKLAKKYRYQYDLDQEMLAIGAANLASGISSGIPVGPDSIRTIDNEEMGAKTQLSGIVGAVLIIVVTLFFTGSFANLPEAVLAALVLFAARDLFSHEALKRIARISRRELTIAGVSMLTVLLIGPLMGIIAGVIMSILDMLHRGSYPHIAVLGQTTAGRFMDVERNPDAREIPGVLICRVDASIIFANARTVKGSLLDKLDKKGGGAELFILDMEDTPLIDITGYDMLNELRAHLRERGVTLRLANASGQVRDTLMRAGYETHFGGLPKSESIREVLDGWKKI